MWIHFGAGNIFRGYIATLAQDAGAEVIAAEGFDTDIIDKIYKPWGNKIITVTLYADGRKELREITSVSEALRIDEEKERIKEIFRSKTLQMVSFTITEKGYVPVDGGLMEFLAEMLQERFENGAHPLALVSMDNCSRNGEILEKGVRAFIKNTEVLKNISFPWSMIDRITPRPDSRVCEYLKSQGYSEVDPITTSKGTYIAPFVNMEATGYLVVEDDFPNGRPPLEKSGVIFTDRSTVERSERMKVTACLNPLHTALAVYGCLLGFESIWEEMKCPELKALVERIGYKEGLPVVENPGIIDPKGFLDEVINERFANPFIPDTPQRIASDTSQKIPIRFGETLKAHAALNRLNSLVGIPLAIAGWLRYLQEPREAQSPDPRLEELREKSPLEILGDKSIFGLDLVEVGLSDKILGYLNKISDKKNILAVLKEELK